MFENFKMIFQNFYDQHLAQNLTLMYQYPVKIVVMLLDIGIVFFLAYKFFKLVKDTRVWQLIKGIILLIIANVLSGFFQLNLLHFILDSLMTYGVLILIVIFQPELRRALEQLGTRNITRFFGIDKDIAARTKEDIYKIAIAATELSKTKTGGLIVIERDIKINDIIETGIQMNSEISPQLLVNIFTPNTPLHDGAVVISQNQIKAAACMLPLASDQDIAKELGTRHRAAIGISKETDSIAVVVSEETGKISLAKDGTLIADVKEEALKKILIKNIVTRRLEQPKPVKQRIFKNLKEKNNKEESTK